MADEEMALPQSSDEDYSPEVKETDTKSTVTISKKSQYTIFDFILMFLFAALIVAMMYLKYREEMFSKEKLKVEVNIKADNYYTLLGVEPGASGAEIKRKYRELAKVWHPDKNPGCVDCREKFEKISEAYNTLSDEIKRSSYDSKVGISKTFRSQTETVTDKNFEDLVVNSGYLWLIQVYDPNSEASEKAAPLWEEFYKQWKGIVKFGRVDATKNTALFKNLPFRIIAYPSIFSYAPTGDYDLLSISSSFNPGELKMTLKELLGKAVERVPATSVAHFLELGPTYAGTKPVTKFNVLLLPKKKKDAPLEYLRDAMNNLGVINFGVVPEEHRVQALKSLKVDSKKNFVFSYKKFNATGEQTQVLESYDVSVVYMNAIISLMIKHSIIDMYRNNYKHYCANYDVETKEGEETEEKEPRRMVCVLALLEKNEEEKMKNFQRYVHTKFAEGYTKITGGKPMQTSTQYGSLDLNWHVELQEFLYKTQQNFKLDKSRLNYLIISPDNDAYTVVAPANSRELDKEIKAFLSGEEDIVKKDYLSNYKIQFVELLSRDDDTLLKALWDMLKSMYTLVSALLAAVGAYVIYKYTKWNIFNTFVGMLIAAYLAQVARFVWVNHKHYFGSHR